MSSGLISDSDIAPQQDYDFLFKLLLIGDSGVGKTPLFCRYADGCWTESMEHQMGLDFKIKTITIDGFVVKLQIWDVCSSNRYYREHCTYYRGSHGVIVVYDITDKTSFWNVKQWMSEVDRYCSKDVHRMIVGNKSDLGDKRAVSSEEVQEYAGRIDVPFFEVSAKTGENVDLVFTTLAKDILKKDLEKPLNEAEKKNDNEDEKKKGGKCLLQ